MQANENAASVDARPPAESAAVPRRRRRWPFVLGAIGILAAISGLVVGRFLRFGLPDVRGLEDYDPPVMSRVLAVDGSIAATFAEQRRTMIEFHDIPVTFRNALVAVEDSGFYRHPGIDLKGIVRALWSDVRHLRLEQGASTITQQLARNLFLHPAKTLAPEGPGGGAGARDRAAVHEARDPAVLLQPDLHGSRPVRARGRGTVLLREARARARARRVGDARRPDPAPGGAVAPAQRGAGDGAGGTTCCGAWSRRDTSMRRRPSAPRASPWASRRRPPGARPWRRTSSRRCDAGSQARYGSSQLYREGLEVRDDARSAAAGDREPRARARACASWTIVRAGAA